MDKIISSFPLSLFGDSMIRVSRCAGGNVIDEIAFSVCSVVSSPVASKVFNVFAIHLVTVGMGSFWSFLFCGARVKLVRSPAHNSSGPNICQRRKAI